MVMSTTVYASVSRKYVMACSHAVRTAGSARSNHGLYIPTILCRGDLGAGEGLGKREIRCLMPDFFSLSLFLNEFATIY